MANKIRRLSIGAEITNQFHFIVGGQQNVTIDGEVKRIAIHSIDENETNYSVNMKIDDEVQEWKRVPKNNITHVEFTLD